MCRTLVVTSRRLLLQLRCAWNQCQEWLLCSKHRFTTLKVRAYIGTASPQAHIIPDYLKHQGLWLVACLGACTGLSPLQKRQRPRCHAIGSQHQQRQGCSPRYMPNNSGHYSLGPAQQDKKNLQEGPVHMLNPRITPLWSMGGIKTNQGCMEKLHNHGDMEQRSILTGSLQLWVP